MFGSHRDDQFQQDEEAVVVSPGGNDTDQVKSQQLGSVEHPATDKQVSDMPAPSLSDDQQDVQLTPPVDTSRADDAGSSAGGDSEESSSLASEGSLTSASLPTVDPQPRGAPTLGSVAAKPSSPHVASGTPASSDAPASDLLDLKRKALEELHPLVSYLDQEPEEQFKTIMMMIQASDDHSLVERAYQAANKIKDEKVRAQALLDVVNEINYFTQQEKQAA